MSALEKNISQLHQHAAELDQVANYLQENILQNASQINAEADYLKLDKNFVSAIKSLYERNKKHDYLSNLIEGMPKKSQRYVLDMVKEEQTQLKRMAGLMKGYGKKLSYLKKIEGKISYWQSRDAIQFSGKGGHSEYKDLVEKYKQLKGDVHMYGSMIKKNANNFMEFKSALGAQIDKYKGNKSVSNPEKMLIALLVGGFGMTVLYALSQTVPGTVTTGAFLESASPMPLAFLSATVIFLLFFLTHHKLK